MTTPRRDFCQAFPACPGRVPKLRMLFAFRPGESGRSSSLISDERGDGPCQPCTMSSAKAEVVEHRRCVPRHIVLTFALIAIRFRIGDPRTRLAWSSLGKKRWVAPGSLRSRRLLFHHEPLSFRERGGAQQSREGGDAHPCCRGSCKRPSFVRQQSRTCCTPEGTHFRRGS